LSDVPGKVFIFCLVSFVLSRMICDQGHARGHRRCDDEPLRSLLLLGRVIRVNRTLYTSCTSCGTAMVFLSGIFTCLECTSPRGLGLSQELDMCWLCERDHSITLRDTFLYGPVSLCGNCHSPALAARVKKRLLLNFRNGRGKVDSIQSLLRTLSQRPY
jgi:hypothetical protein